MRPGFCSGSAEEDKLQRLIDRQWPLGTPMPTEKWNRMWAWRDRVYLAFYQRKCSADEAVALANLGELS